MILKKDTFLIHFTVAFITTPVKIAQNTRQSNTED